MRILFFNHRLGFPRGSGSDVHGFFMMRALADLGHEIFLATNEPPGEQALGDVPYSGRVVLPSQPDEAVPRTDRRRAHAGYFSERFRRYWGIGHSNLDVLEAFASEHRIEALIAVGLEALPYLTIAGRFRRVWYAADEGFLHHVSLVKPGTPSTLTHLRPALIKLLYERAHTRIVDRVWVVSPADRWAMRNIAGFRGVDLIPNGVDADHFSVARTVPRPLTCVFWGRLDFEPNVQGVEWFAKEVWPIVRARFPEATLDLLGFNPIEAVKQLHGQSGITVVADLPDLRNRITACAVAVLPLVSGRGIKNKTLEAASLGMPMVATSLACAGLRDESIPLVRADNAEAFADGLTSLLGNSAQAEAMGQAARRWVVNHHSWRTAALEATASLESLSNTVPS